MLGFEPCVQMQTMWQRPELAAAWAAHYRGDPAYWLTLRDGPAWYDSVMGSIHEWTAPGKDVGPPPVVALLDRVWDEHFDGWHGVFDRDRTLARYEAHVADVRRDCPPERLVEWRAADGWATLCQALEVEVSRPAGAASQQQVFE